MERQYQTFLKLSQEGTGNAQKDAKAMAEGIHQAMVEFTAALDWKLTGVNFRLPSRSPWAPE